MDYVLIALLPVVPVALVGMLAERKRTLHITAGVMAALGLLTGNPAYAVLDFIVVGLAWMAFANLREWAEPKDAQSSEIDKRRWKQ